MNAADRHYLNCDDEDCEVASCVGRRDYERQILNLETQIEETKKPKQHDAISCFNSKCTELPCLFVNYPDSEAIFKASVKKQIYNELEVKPKRKFKLKERYLINFSEADHLGEVFGIKQLEAALKDGADDVTGNSFHETKFKKQQQITTANGSNKLVKEIKKIQSKRDEAQKKTIETLDVLLNIGKTTTCSVCNEQQFNTRSGITCKNGHGGAPSIHN